MMTSIPSSVSVGRRWRLSMAMGGVSGLAWSPGRFTGITT